MTSSALPWQECQGAVARSLELSVLEAGLSAGRTQLTLIREQEVYTHTHREIPVWSEG